MGPRQRSAGETVNYTYDSLARLSTAAIAGSSGWGLSWSYDGWGNRLAQSVTKGSGPTTALTRGCGDEPHFDGVGLGIR